MKRPPIWCFGRAREQIFPHSLGALHLSDLWCFHTQKSPRGDHLLVGGTTAGGKEGSLRFRATPTQVQKTRERWNPGWPLAPLKTQPGDGVLAICSQVPGNSDVFLRIYHVPQPPKINN